MIKYLKLMNLEKDSNHIKHQTRTMDTRRIYHCPHQPHRLQTKIPNGRNGLSNRPFHLRTHTTITGPECHNAAKRRNLPSRLHPGQFGCQHCRQYLGLHLTARPIQRHHRTTIYRKLPTGSRRTGHCQISQPHPFGSPLCSSRNSH